MVLVGRRLKKDDFRLHAGKLQQIDDECKRVEARLPKALRAPIKVTNYSSNSRNRTNYWNTDCRNFSHYDEVNSQYYLINL